MTTPMSRVRTLGPLAAAGAASAGVVAAVFLLGDERHPDLCESDGFEEIGCTLAIGALLVTAAVAVAALTNYLVLRRLRVQHAGPITGLGVVAYVAWFQVFDELIAGGNIRSLSFLFPPALLNVLFYEVLKRVPAKAWRMPLLVVGIVIATLPLTTVSGAVSTRRQENARVSKIAHADFAIYQPLALPGYAPEEVEVLGPNGEKIPQFAAWTAWGSDDVGSLRPYYTVRSFRLPATFNRRANCGSATGFTDSTEKCSEVARTARGEPVYVDPEATVWNEQVFFIPRGDTLVTVETGVPHGLTLEEVVIVLNRLRRAN